MADHRDLFISYSNQNLTRAEQIVSAVKYFGVTCWFQMRDSKKNYVEEINNAINHSSDFVVLLSNASVSSLMVRNEIARAIYQQKKDPAFSIIPVVIEELTEENMEVINLFLGSLNWLDAGNYNDDKSLALAIFEQANLEPVHEEEGKPSNYSTEKEAERIRLKEQNAFFNQYAKMYLDELFAKYPSPAVLDVGCDNGDNIMLRLAGRNYKFLLGVDTNEAAVAEANEHYGSEKAAFVCCDVTREDFFRSAFKQMQKRGLFGFDIIHISAVLLHLGKAAEALKSLYLLLNPGGSIFIQDEDDGMNVGYPYSQYFEDCFYIWEHSKESGDRRMGRKIPLLLKEAGFSSVTLHSSTISSLDFGGEYREAFWALYFDPNLWAADSAAYFDNYEAFDLLSKVRARHDEMKAAYMNGDYFITLGVFFYTAVKEEED